MTQMTIQESELRYRRLFESAHDGILILDAKTGLINDVNPFLINLLGYSREEFLQKKLWEVGAFHDIGDNIESFKKLQVKQYIRYEDLPLKTKDGRLIQVEFISNAYLVNNEKVIQCNIRDITARKQAEAILLEKEYILSQSQRHAHIGSWGWDLTGLIKWTEEAYRVFGVSPEDIVLTPESLINLVHPEDRHTMRGWLESCRTGNSHENLEFRTILPDGSIRFINGTGNLMYDINGNPAFIAGTVQDITEQKSSEFKIQRQIEHLKALSVIDRFISANFDLKITLSEILTHVTNELGVDAANILTLNPATLFLDPGADFGFRSDTAKKTHLKLGESYAGLVALNREMIHIPDLKEEPENFLLAATLKNEEFVCYYGVPLIAKGQVKGVLEIFNRTALYPDMEWMNFLHSLASQTAIAIDNATMFEGLQQSNLELHTAYDATIEGWSRALDMRDMETKVHTTRVTDMTIKLARFLGQPDPEMVNIRWGALLHDIGKMGIPDSILLKPTKLSKMEWDVMKKHPALAHEMLFPIRYLRQSLDIPYCHHEKWDGSGYPQGLAGTQIPIFARIFAVVDVWDALNSDRPYRKAWSTRKIHRYILDGSGSHFDPLIVPKFMEILEENQRSGRQKKNSPTDVESIDLYERLPS
jgi:PAS domain S-box-containing protein